MNVSAEAMVALPPRLRPTADQVCNWYAHTLMVMGADVRRTAPGQLEFSLDVSRTFFDANLKASLAPLSRGELEVTDTAEGFEVSVRAEPRSWVSYLPLVVFGFLTGGLAFVATPMRYAPALSGLAIMAFAWLRAWTALNRFLDTTNAAITRSFVTVPPTPHALGAEPPVPTR